VQCSGLQPMPESVMSESVAPVPLVAKADTHRPLKSQRATPEVPCSSA
jgi:hypothetical protein